MLPILARPLTVAAVLALVVVVGIPPPPAIAGGWRWPVRGPVLARFHVTADRFAAGQRRGIAIGAAAGTTVRSVCPGSVTFAGTVGDRGRVVSVACADGLTATYLHLGTVAVRRGGRLAAGGSLGTVGRSGRPEVDAPHLRLGARVTGRAGAYVDPLALLGDPVPRAPFGAAPVAGPFGPAPTVAPARHRLHPLAAPPTLAALHAHAPGRAGVPVTVWLGIVMVVLGLPGVGLRWRRRRHHRRHAAGAIESQWGTL